MSVIRAYQLGVTAALGLLLVSRPTFCASQTVSGEAGLVDYDCGAIALHALLAIEGLPTPIGVVQSRLPRRTREGYSMTELREGAQALGLRLTGVRLPQSKFAPDRPALVFLRQAGHGHFLVIRPVGHSSRMVQIIDVRNDPVVADAVDLYTSPQWTGLALVPTRSTWALRLAASLVGGGCSVCALYVVTRFRRLKRAAMAGTPA